METSTEKNVSNQSLPLKWKSASILLISIVFAFYSFVRFDFIIKELFFIIGSLNCLLLFIYKKSVWINIFSILIVLKIIYILPEFFVTLEFYIGNLKINLIPLIFLVIHFRINHVSFFKYIKKLHKSEDTIIKEYKSKVKRFELKYQYKTKDQLKDIVENKEVMVKEAVEAATNLLIK